MSRTDDVYGVTIVSIIAWLLYFPPTLWVGIIPVYSGTTLLLEVVFVCVLAMLWVWALWT